MKVNYTNYLKKQFWIESFFYVFEQDCFKPQHKGVSSICATIIKLENFDKMDEFYFHVFNLFTEEEHRNKGHAKRLISYVSDYAKNFGCDGLHLYCKSDLIDFYKNLGFKKIGNYQGRIEMIRSF